VRPIATDRYGRTVARVTCAGIDANAAMVEAGMAWAFTKYATSAWMPKLEAKARGERAGLWADTSPVAPWEWRRSQSARGQ
jgi:endonuclease YncB( thermonuclease family)